MGRGRIPRSRGVEREGDGSAGRLRFVLLHGDLHHRNIVRHGAKWIAIDPKGVSGPPEAEAAAFLRNPRNVLITSSDPAALLAHRVRRISAALAYDPSTVAEWGYVMSVVAAAWVIEDGESQDKAAKWLRCADGFGEVSKSSHPDRW
jgi:streptomycin 6-kinase